MLVSLLQAILTVSLMSGVVWAKPAETTSVKTKASTKTKKTRVFVGDQSDLMPSANSFGLITSYTLSFDQLAQVEMKTVSHRVGLAGTYSFDKFWSAYAALAANHETYSNKIIRDNEKDYFHKISNVNMGLVHNINNPVTYMRRMSNTLNLALPVSERSRVDKHIANIGFTNFIQSGRWANMFLFNRFNLDFLWNTQKFSLFSGDIMNRDWLISNSFGLHYQAFDRVGFRVSSRLNSIRYLDKSWNLGFGSNISIFTSLAGLQIYVGMINNSYPENERLDFGYYDKYKRLFIGGVTYAF